ncbi:hypothetical protein HDU82_004032 [Entophlyctis luteolus]|nr:hypothetical protein HDU82_004032 [Entophlyctis luteolus]
MSLEVQDFWSDLFGGPDALTLDTPLAQQCSSGILADSQGRVQGLWLSFLGERNQNSADVEYHMGTSFRMVKPILQHLQETASANFYPPPKLRGLTVELSPVQMAQARHMGLSDEWIRKVEQTNRHRRQLFMVRRVEAGKETSRFLKELDLILAIDGKEPHRAVLHQSKSLPSRVYVSGRSKGSPSYMYGLGQTQWVTHVNGVSTPDLESFFACVSQLADNEYVRVKTISFDNVPCVLSIKNNLHYFPTCEMRRDDREGDGNLCSWTQRTVGGSGSGGGVQGE